MDAANFLARVIAPGNFMCLCFKGPGMNGLGQKFYPRADIAQATSFAHWGARNKMDIWHANASYRDAEQDGVDRGGRPRYKGRRTQANVHMLNSFWYDADIARPGDGKAAGSTFADLAEVDQWVAQFSAATGLLEPNLWVRSGYGVHLYWILEDAIDRTTWQPYANALRDALLAHQGRGDLGITIDSARILRPPDTFNFKVPASPMPVEVRDHLTRGDWPNHLIYKALQPFVGRSPAPALVNRAPAANLPALPSGAPAAAFAQPSATTAAAAMNVPVPSVQRRDHTSSDIAANGCLQIQRSLAENGLNDAYDVWYKGWVSLAVFLIDGDQFIHQVSSAHPSYDPAKVDAAFVQAQGEQQTKSLGAPSCVAINTYKPGICPGCPHFGHIKGPFTLGTSDWDLPLMYRRQGGTIERGTKNKTTSTIEWTYLITGDFAQARLTHGDDGDHFTCNYRLNITNNYNIISFSEYQLVTDNGRLQNYFARHRITLIDVEQARFFRRWLMAWISRLRDTTAVKRHYAPIGWNRDKDGFIGFAVSDALYRPNSVVEEIFNPDRSVATMFEPLGTLAKWTEAANFVIKDRAALQILVASAFAAPLIPFTGEQGLIMSAWSRISGVGKTSALRAAQTVWGDVSLMQQLTDTLNSVNDLIGKTPNMPSYWDEIQIGPGQGREAIMMLFQLTSGRDKRRLTSDITQRAPRNWSTILVTTSNASMLDHISTLHGHTDAAALRTFEMCVDEPGKYDPRASMIVARLNQNRGNAGRVYAAWLANHVDWLGPTVDKLVDTFSNDPRMPPIQGERFFISLMSCIMVGAGVAKNLNLVDFDLQAMYDRLRSTFLELRKTREEELPVSNSLTGIADILNKFMNEHRGSLLVVDEFPTQNNPHLKSIVFIDPTRLGGSSYVAVATHIIGEKNRTLRISKEAFTKFCYDNKLSYSAVKQQMVGQWNANLVRRAYIGRGTLWSTTEIRAIDIPLDKHHPDLGQYLDAVPDQVRQQVLKAAQHAQRLGPKP